MMEDELGGILQSMYDSAPQGYKVANIHLFGIRHAAAIQDGNLSVKAIVLSSGLKECYIAEVYKGVRLSRYVTPNDSSWQSDRRR